MLSMDSRHTQKFGSDNIRSTKSDHQALEDEAQAELTAARAEYRSARAAAGLSIAVERAIGKASPPTLPNADGLSTTERREVVRNYDSAIQRQAARSREAEELRQIAAKHAKKGA